MEEEGISGLHNEIIVGSTNLVPIRRSVIAEVVLNSPTAGRTTVVFVMCECGAELGRSKEARIHLTWQLHLEPVGSE